MDAGGGAKEAEVARDAAGAGGTAGHGGDGILVVPDVERYQAGGERSVVANEELERLGGGDSSDGLDGGAEDAGRVAGGAAGGRRFREEAAEAGAFARADRHDHAVAG